ncbi:MAG: glucose-1-phosphate thymidylyltransferase, partial [Candidatus Hydrothermarchaeota archaeon]
KLGVKINYAEQNERLGTAHALSMVYLDEDFLALNGDTIITSKALEKLIKNHEGKVTLGLKKVDDPRNYGVVELEKDRVLKIVEKPKEKISDLANAGIYVFSPEIFKAIEKTPKSERGEYEITTSINIMIENGEEVKGVVFEDIWLDIGTPWGYLDANKVMLERMEERIEGEVEENVTIKGKLVLGKNSVIKSGSYIEGPVYIGENTKIGPNTYLRSFSTIGNNCKIGNAVEIKNSIIMDYTNVPHLSYVGDSIIGRRCNLGAGTKVGNLRLDERNVKMRIKGKLVDTGRRKMGCLIGDNVKFGLNVMINSGRKIGSNSKIGPGVIVYSDIPKNSLVVVKQELEFR